jgi:hypothetical protein
MCHFLPDAKVELAVFGRGGLFYDWASRLRLRMLRRPAVPAAPIVEATSGLLVVTSECIAVRQWEGDRLLTESLVNRTGTACLRRSKQCEITDDLCADPRSDGYAPLADVSSGVGGFVPKDWIDKSVCFLTYINRFRTGKETPTELAVLEQWHRAVSLASSLGLNQ